MDRGSWSAWWAHNGVDTVFTVALGFAAGATAFIPTYGARRVIERDPTLSYPLQEESVGVAVLLLLSVVLPWVAILCSQLFMRFREVENTFSNDMSKSQLGLFQSLFITLVFVNIVKVFVGKPRPNFFALCDYRGFRNAVLTNNYTEYNNLTTPGHQVLSGEICNDQNAYQSFPSGHAALAFAGLGFLTLFWYGSLDLSLPNKVWKLVAGAVPLFVAVLVAGSRSRDYYHFTEDIATGAMIGGTVAYGAYCMHFRPRSNRPLRHSQGFALVDSVC